MKFIMCAGFAIAYMLGGMYLENIGFSSPAFFAFYGATSVILFVALMTKIKRRRN